MHVLASPKVVKSGGDGGGGDGAIIVIVIIILIVALIVVVVNQSDSMLFAGFVSFVIAFVSVRFINSFT
jgi:hypothetical protein